MTSRQRERERSGGREAIKGAALAVAIALVSLLAVGWSSASAQQDPEPPAAPAEEQDPKGPAERRFRPVLERVVNGDLVMAGNSNLISAGGWRSGDVTVADADPDSTELCIIRGLGFPRACADNSSSARLDVPEGARIVAARLYVQTTVATDVGPLRVQLDGPGRRYTYTELGGATLGVRKVYEAAGRGREGEPLRQAVWDVTKYVTKRGAGWYTVADIVTERAAPFLPYASWAIVAAYEFDPSSGEQIASLPVDEQHRFAERAVTWYDGFTYLDEGALSVPVTGFEVPATGGVFAKTFHFVGHGQLGRPDNLLFNGNPVGNNLTPGDASPPDGVDIGANPSCNSTTDVMNDTVCVLGTPVMSKRPGPRQYRASGDGRTRTSGSGVETATSSPVRTRRRCRCRSRAAMRSRPACSPRPWTSPGPPPTRCPPICRSFPRRSIPPSPHWWRTREAAAHDRRGDGADPDRRVAGVGDRTARDRGRPAGGHAERSAAHGDRVRSGGVRVVDDDHHDDGPGRGAL
jgi:hypothetical protein